MDFFDFLIPFHGVEPWVQPGQHVFPEDTIFGRIERNRKAAADAEHTAQLAATIALIAKVVPSLPGRIIATLGAGVEKTAEGKIVPGLGTAGNFAPQPFGFMPATDFGLKPNFYLPAGSTAFIPREVDRFGLGVPEQRAIDQARETRAGVQEIQGRTVTAKAIVSRESDDTLRDMVAQRGAFRRAGVVFATSPVSASVLIDQAGAELFRRAEAAALATAQPAPVPAPLFTAPLESREPIAGAKLPLEPTTPSASIQPEAIEPVADAALRNRASAKGIRRMLVHERADP